MVLTIWAEARPLCASSACWFLTSANTSWGISPPGFGFALDKARGCSGSGWAWGCLHTWICELVMVSVGVLQVTPTETDGLKTGSPVWKEKAIIILVMLLTNWSTSVLICFLECQKVGNFATKGLKKSSHKLDYSVLIVHSMSMSRIFYSMKLDETNQNNGKSICRCNSDLQTVYFNSLN